MSELIWNERRKPNPDRPQVEKWEAESKGYWHERRQMRYDDPASHRAALDKYGPLVRAYMKEPLLFDHDSEKLEAQEEMAA